MHAGVPQVGLVGAPWVRLEVAAGAGGQSIRIQPRALYLLDWRVSVPAPLLRRAAAAPAPATMSCSPP